MKERERGEMAGSEVNVSVAGPDLSEKGKKAVIEFTATKCAVLEKEQRVRVGIRRYGHLSNRVIFK